MKFIETPIFTKEVQTLLEDDEYKSLQIALLLRPEQGSIIPGSSGLRKVRWAIKGKGKRGGLRVIYYWDPKRNLSTCCLFIQRAKKMIFHKISSRF